MTFLAALRGATSEARRAFAAACRQAGAVAFSTLWACIMLATPAGAQELEWKRQETGPSPRLGHSVVHDTARSVTVLFGGNGLSDTWEWNGTVWIQRLVSGPPGLSGHAMAYDAERRVTVLFGQRWDGAAFIAETWEWDGKAWTQRIVDGPRARERHAMAYDALRGVTMLFGGRVSYGTWLSDTWEWNGTSWTERAVPAPPARYGHAMSYDAARARTVLFGGCDVVDKLSHRLADTWEWDGSAWTPRPIPGPPARSDHAMAYDVGRGVTALFGGYTGQYPYWVADTWEWYGTTWTQRTSEGPTLRASHAMSYDAARGTVLLFGGGLSEGTSRSDTWEWDGASWTRRHASSPPGRRRHIMAYDAASGNTVLFGGFHDHVLTDAWTWTGTDWTEQESGPYLVYSFGGGLAFDEARAGMAYDAVREVSVLVGTTWVGSALNDTWEWDGTSWTERMVPGPGLSGPLAYDSGRGVTVYQHAGTWEWDGTTWTERTVPGPAFRVDHKLAYDAVRGVTVLFGGCNCFEDHREVRADTWEWDGVAWTERIVTGPPARYSYSMAYDSALSAVVLFGGVGENGDALSDTWEWDGAQWTQRLITGPPVNGDMVYDSARGVMVLFGGLDGQLWELGIRCLADFNDDSRANSQDFFDFLTAFFSADPAADFNQDLVVNSQDFFDFLGAFFEGC